MGLCFAEHVALLREAREIVSGEMRQLHRSAACEAGSVLCLQEVARGFAENADLLAVALMERRAPLVRVREVEELLDFFRAADERLMCTLACCKA